MATIDIGKTDDDLKKYKTYVLKVDPNQNDKASEIKLLNFSRPHMRAFHCSWSCFFSAFFIWFAIAPLLTEVRISLGISKAEIWTSNICSVGGTILMRFALGPLCDKFGARLLMGSVLMAASIPTALIGLVQSAAGLAACRFFIGLGGSTFVMCQYWTTVMFTKEVAGTANALVGGWGNLGGGVTQIVMGSVLFPLFKAFGLSANDAWRTVCIVPAVVAFTLGFMMLRISDDCPKGNYKDMKQKGIMSEVSAAASFRDGAMNVNTWLLFLQYACCFGVELTMNNAAATYFQEEFKLTTETAAAIASIFGWMNLFARGLGGFTSDKLNSKMGMRGRLIWQTVCLLIEGGMVLIFAQTRNLAVAIIILVIFSSFVQAAEGSTYGIVPYVDPASTGSIVGIVGAGGNTGAVCFGLGFRQLGYVKAFNIMGATILASAALPFLITIKGHRSILCGEDSDIVKRAWQAVPKNAGDDKFEDMLEERISSQKLTIGTPSYFAKTLRISTLIFLSPICIISTISIWLIVFIPWVVAKPIVVLVSWLATELNSSGEPARQQRTFSECAKSGVMGSLLFAVNMVWFVILRWLIKVRLVFAVYTPLGGECYRDRLIDPLLLAALPFPRISIFLTFVHHGNDKWGMQVGSIYPIENMSANELAKTTAAIVKCCPFARSIAMAGRWPAMMSKNNLEIPSLPYVNATTGTIYSMAKAVLSAAKIKNPKVKIELDLRKQQLFGVLDHSINNAQIVNSHKSNRQLTALEAFEGSDVSKGGNSYEVLEYNHLPLPPLTSPNTNSNQDSTICTSTSTTVDNSETESSFDYTQLEGVESSRELVIVVLGGGGFASNNLVPILARLFRKVISLDPRYTRPESIEEAQSIAGKHLMNIEFTTEKAMVSHADVVLQLTPKGADAEEYLPFIVNSKSKIVWLDDCFPEMPSELQERFHSVSTVTLTKPGLAHKGVYFYPKQLLFGRSNLPGCMVAAVVNEIAPGCLVSIDAMFREAEINGEFEGRLFQHRGQ